MRTCQQAREWAGRNGAASADAGPGWLKMVHGILAHPATGWLLLGIGLLATILATVGAWRQAREQDEDRFLAYTEEFRTSLLRGLDRYVRVLNSARALWAVHPASGRNEWREYVESLELFASFPGLHALGYIERVPAAELHNFIEKARKTESQDGPGPSFQAYPQNSASEHYVVRLVEPLGANQPALGYDIGSEPVRRQAAEQARDSGKATLTHKIALVQAPESAGVLLLVPLYSAGLQATNVEMRRATLTGWVYAAFVVEDVLVHSRPPGKEEVEVQVFDGSQVSAEAQLAGPKSWGERAGRGRRGLFERTDQMEWGDVVWTVRYRAGPGFARTQWFSAPGYMPAAGLGLCISGLVFGIVRSLADTRRRAQVLANEMTAKLRLQHNAMACARNGLFILDASQEDCPIIYANPAFERLTGYSVAERLGKETLTMLRDGGSAADPFGMRGILQGGAAEHTVVRKYLKGNNPLWAEFRLVPVLGEKGQRTHFLGIVEDVTERKRAEEELAKAEERYHELVDHLSVGVYRNTPWDQGKFVEVNPALVAMLEATSKEALLRHNVSDFFVDPAQRQKLDERIRRNGSVTEAEVELSTLKGRRFWAAITATMQTDGDGGRFLNGIIVDITARKQVERALKESQERFALAVQGASDGIWDWNLITDETYFSPRWKSMLGYEEHEIENTFLGWRELLHPEDQARALEAIQNYLSGHTTTYELEHRLRHKDGTYRWILARGVVQRDAQGKPLRMAGSHVDLTSRKLAEDRLRVAYQELADSQEALKDTVRQLKASHEELQQTQLQLIRSAKMECIGTLAAGVAHEVKNPLQTILTGLDYLEHRLAGNSEDLRLALADMRDAVSRADTIVRDLLQLSADKVFELTDGDLNSVVERSLRLVNSEVVATQTRIVRCLEPNLPRVRMDARKMEQALLNLFLNALQAMEQGGTLRLTTRSGRLGEGLQLAGSLEDQFRPGERLVVAEIQDTGPGITQEHLPRVLDPFFTTKPVGKGTGLGLSIVKKIIDLHRGALEVLNAAEGGVVVILVLRAEEGNYEQKADHDRG